MPAPVPGAELQQLLEQYPDDVQGLVAGARRLLLAWLPGTSEFTDVKSRVIGYGVGSGYKETIATLILSRTGVKIGIVGGASLADPAGLLEGSGKVHRFVAIREPADLNRPELARLLKSACARWKGQR